jgi:hypothetical protein
MSLIACGEEEKDDDVIDPLTVDDDGDGFTEEQGDCDDDNADLSPGATEVCDEIDNDCDGDIDDADASVDLSTGSVFYADEDGDTYGNADMPIEACVMPEDSVENMDDCDDTSATVSPDGIEVCDTVDNDCDGMIDDDDDSLDATTGSTFYSDADGDGEGDADSMVMACVLPEGSVDNMTDCDDTSAEMNTADIDSDGLTSCGEDTDGDGSIDVKDCDDANDTVGATDADEDGSIACINDCDDDNASVEGLDTDADGVSTCDGDCDDADAAVGATDVDGDGFSACYNDCDDDSATTFPGAAFNEADATACLNDSDADGYGDYMGFTSLACVAIDMVDSYGDGWNGNAVNVWEDGVVTGTYANDSTYSGGAVHTEVHCFDSGTVAVDFQFEDGSYNSEVFLALSNADTGEAIGIGQGAGSYDFIWEGTTFTDGDVFYSVADVNAIVGLTGGSDCDDSDATTYGDDDGDGYMSCLDDCDDTDAALNPGVDNDADGFDTCNDCDDNDNAINPDAEEVWYDGIDTDCDGWNDYDADYDGDPSMMYSGSCSDATLMDSAECEGAGTCDDGVSTDQATCETAMGVWTSAGNTWTATGYDCRDDDDAYLSLADEADPTACYYDNDGDGFGTINPSTTAQGYGVVEGTDCYDYVATVYPGAAYMELDVDGDGVTDCTQDVDGDGFGNATPASYYNASEGTDCDDGDADLAPGLDADADGVESCEDCDDSDATAQGGYLYTDSDADGEGDYDDEGVLTCDLTALDSDGDSVDDLSTTNLDCDDNDSTSVGDDDGDGYYSCDDDCDDTDAYTFPGAAYLDSTTECMTDADGDGYGYGSFSSCYTIDMEDSYGDGWNGNAIEVYVGQTLIETATLGSSTSAGSAEVCVNDGDVVDMVFVSGSYTGEISGMIYGTDSALLGSFDGTTGSSWSGVAATLNFSDGVSYLDGDTFYTETAVEAGVGGSDADDSDPLVY